jgi:hypothetical protein
MQRIRYQAARVELALNDRSGSQAAVEVRTREVRSTRDNGRAADFKLLRGQNRTRTVLAQHGGPRF